MEPPRPTWFYRRPCFWAAAAAVLAVCLSWELQVPAIVWLLAALAACIVFALGFRAVGIVLLIGGCIGVYAAVWIELPLHSALPPGEQVTLRGRLAHSAGQSSGPPRVLQARYRLSSGQWQGLEEEVGLYPPDGAAEGDLIEISGELRQPLPATNPGCASPRLGWLRRGIHLVLHVRKAGYRKLGHEDPPPWVRTARALRAGILQANRRTLSPEAAVIANDFLIGDTDSPDPELASSISDRFRDSGTIHLLVVSGTQVTLVMAPFLWLGVRFHRARWWMWLLGVMALCLFYITTENSASVLRAAVMGGCVVLARVFKREPDVENTLGLSALVLLVLNPLEVYDIGALLTFGAVWSLARLSPAIEQALGPKKPEPQDSVGVRYRFHKQIAQVLGATIAAHMLTAPILAATRQRTTWSGIPSDVIVFVVAIGFTYFALAHVIVSGLHVPWLTGWLVEYSAKALLGWASFFAQPPFGASDVFPTPLWLVPLLLIGAVVPKHLPKDRIRPLAWTLGLAGMLLLSERLPAAPPAAPTLRAIDVGQGDAVLLQGTDGSNVLVDAGPEPWRPELSPLVRTLRALRVPQLDAVVVSHGHKDHMGGLPAVLDAIPTRMLVHNVRTGDWAEWTRVLESAHRHHIPVTIPHPGDRLSIRQSTLTVLGPMVDPALPPPADPNDESLVMRWDSGGARFMLTGDMGQNTEPQLLPWGPELKCDVLKVGHHGSRMATTPEWLAAVQPRAAVISCGRDNSYGHPAPETLSRLRNAHVPVLRTDRGGMLTVSVRNGRVESETYLHE